MSADVQKYLARMEFFASFQEQELLQLSTVLKLRKYLPKQIVFKETERGKSCYFVAAGEIVSCKVVPGVKKKEIVGRHGQGEIFGLVSLIDQKPRFSTCFANVESVLLELDSDNFELLFNARSNFAFKFQELICRVLVRQLKAANQNLAFFSDKPKEKRQADEAMAAIIGTSKLIADLGVNLDDIKVMVPDGMKYRQQG